MLSPVSQDDVLNILAQDIRSGHMSRGTQALLQKTVLMARVKLREQLLPMEKKEVEQEEIGRLYTQAASMTGVLTDIDAAKNPALQVDAKNAQAWLGTWVDLKTKPSE
jgi:hypothetical protein